MAMDKKWELKAAADQETVSRLASELGIDHVLAELLAQRGLHTFEDARAFFRPNLDNLHDPFLMKDMDKAVERVSQAVLGGEKILVYGDYDVDGTTAVALVYSFLLKFTSKIGYYIPDRYDEGYGVSFKSIDWAAEGEFDPKGEPGAGRLPYAGTGWYRKSFVLPAESAGQCVFLDIGGAMSVPITVSDRELTGAILEDMAYLSMKTVKPAYVDVLLQGKFLRDEESLVTLEIMFGSYYSDIGFMTGSSGISILSEQRGYIDNNRTDFVSRIEKKIKSYNKSLEKIKTTYLEDRD